MAVYYTISAFKGSTRITGAWVLLKKRRNLSKDAPGGNGLEDQALPNTGRIVNAALKLINSSFTPPP
jgi:hypothetical protein